MNVYSIGDILVHTDDNRKVFIVLKVDLEKSMVFSLNHNYKDWIGQIHIVWCEGGWYENKQFKKIQNMDLKNVL